MGEPIRTRKRELAGRGKHDARLSHVVQVKTRGGGNPLGRRKATSNLAVSQDYASCWVHKDLAVTTHAKTDSGVVDSSEGVGRKGRMSNTTDRYRAGILDGHRDRLMRRLQLPRHSHSGSLVWI